MERCSLHLVSQLADSLLERAVLPGFVLMRLFGRKQEGVVHWSGWLRVEEIAGQQCMPDVVQRAGGEDSHQLQPPVGVPGEGESLDIVPAEREAGALQFAVGLIRH